jgi:3-dehydroquinate dehydratase/shikimate dehydrogenase
MSNRLAVPLAEPDTDACLARLKSLAPSIGLAELRLDLMPTFDLPRLIAESPCPLIITCRPPREGGRFSGSEETRLGILAQAMNLGCAYVDVEWDRLDWLAAQLRTKTRVIVSRHWHDRMPEDLWALYTELRQHADVVKLVGTAHRPADMFPVFDLLWRATTPVIGIAMGAAGQLTRLLAPCFQNCLLTYASPTTDGATAPGQFTVREMVEVYHLPDMGPHTAIHLHLCADEASVKTVVAQNASVIPGDRLYAALVVAANDAHATASGLQACLPHHTLTADAALGLALRVPL